MREYLTTFRKVVEILYNEYVPALQKRFEAAVIREASGLILSRSQTLCHLLSGARPRRGLPEGGLRVQATGGLVVPPIYGHDLLSESRWSKWSGAIRTLPIGAPPGSGLQGGGLEHRHWGDHVRRIEKGDVPSSGVSRPLPMPNAQSATTQTMRHPLQDFERIEPCRCILQN